MRFNKLEVIGVSALAITALGIADNQQDASILQDRQTVAIEQFNRATRLQGMLRPCVELEMINGSEDFTDPAARQSCLLGGQSERDLQVEVWAASSYADRLDDDR